MRWLGRWISETRKASPDLGCRLGLVCEERAVLVVRQEETAPLAENVQVPEEQHGHRRHGETRVFVFVSCSEMTGGFVERPTITQPFAKERIEGKVFAGWPHAPVGDPEEARRLTGGTPEHAEQGHATAGVRWNGKLEARPAAIVEIVNGWAA
jgi:hypothetical protein